jgi:hypothetical protein
MVGENCTMRAFASLLLAIISLPTCAGENRDGPPPRSDLRAAEPVPSREPIDGHRFVLTGDFDGDDRIDTLGEHYRDPKSGTELPKGYAGDDYDSLVSRAYSVTPIVRVEHERGGLAALTVGKGSPMLGLAYLRNEGDIDGDGRDELAYVIDYADWSGVNRCVVVSMRDGRWIERASFGIRESDLVTDDGLASRDLDTFSLLRRVRRGVIHVHTRAEESSDSIEIGDPVDLELTLWPLGTSTLGE